MVQDEINESDQFLFFQQFDESSNMQKENNTKQKQDISFDDMLRKKHIAKTLLILSQTTPGWFAICLLIDCLRRGLDVLSNILKRNTIMPDGSLKPNDFSKLDRLYLNLVIIKGICKLQDDKQGEITFVSSNTVELILKLLRENDNSNNQADDEFYRAHLIYSLLYLINHNYIHQILAEIILALQQEISFLSSTNIVFLKILKNLTHFFEINNLKKLDLEVNNQPLLFLIAEILKKIKFLATILKDNILIQTKYFLFKLQLKYTYFCFHSWELIIYGLKKIEKKKSSNYQIELYAADFAEFVKQNQQLFAEQMQITLNLTNQAKIASLLWETLISMFLGYSIGNPHFRTSFLKIYKAIYFYFIPISSIPSYYQKTSKEYSNEVNSFLFSFTHFTIDSNWLKECMQKDKSEQHQKKQIINLKYLSLKKRKRANLEKQKINPKLAILGCFKQEDEQITFKSLGKNILNLILNEKTTEGIEKHLNELSAPQNENNLLIKLKKPLTLKIVKKNILKNKYCSLDIIEEDILEVINQYYKKNLIENNIFDEYQLLIERLFVEARQILKEAQVEGKQFNFRKKKKDIQYKFRFGDQEYKLTKRQTQELEGLQELERLKLGASDNLKIKINLENKSQDSIIRLSKMQYQTEDLPQSTLVKLPLRLPEEYPISPDLNDSQDSSKICLTLPPKPISHFNSYLQSKQIKKQ